MCMLGLFRSFVSLACTSQFIFTTNCVIVNWERIINKDLYKEFCYPDLLHNVGFPFCSFLLQLNELIECEARSITYSFIFGTSARYDRKYILLPDSLFSSASSKQLSIIFRHFRIFTVFS